MLISRIMKNTSTFIVKHCKFIAPFHELLERLIDMPIIFLGLIIAAGNSFQWIFLLMMLCSILGTIWIDFRLIPAWSNCKKYLDLLKYMDKYSHCTFQCYDLQKILVNDLNIDEKLLDIFQLPRIRKFFNKQFVNSNLGWLCVVNRKEACESFPSVLTSFPIANNPSFIMSTEIPSIKNTIGLFHLLHELGHLTYNQAIVSERHLRHRILGLLSIMMVSITSGGNPIAVLLIIGFFLIWDELGKLFSMKELELEANADAFAIFALHKHPDFSRMERLYKLGLSRSLRKEDVDIRMRYFERCKDWANEPAKIVSNIHLNTMYNFNACTQSIRNPNFKLFFIIALLMVITGTFCRYSSILGLVIYSLVTIAIPFFLSILYTSISFACKSKVMKALGIMETNGLYNDSEEV